MRGRTETFRLHRRRSIRRVNRWEHGIVCRWWNRGQHCSESGRARWRAVGADSDYAPLCDHHAMRRLDIELGERSVDLAPDLVVPAR